MKNPENVEVLLYYVGIHLKPARLIIFMLATVASSAIGQDNNDSIPPNYPPRLSSSRAPCLVFPFPDNIPDDTPLPPQVMCNPYFIYRLPKALSNAGINISFKGGSGTENTTRKYQDFIYTLNTSDITLLMDKTGQLLKDRIRQVHKSKCRGSINNVLPYSSSNVAGSLIYEACYRPPSNHILKIIIIEDKNQPEMTGFLPEGFGFPAQ